MNRERKTDTGRSAPRRAAAGIGFALALCLIAGLALAGCEKKSEPPPDDEGLLKVEQAYTKQELDKNGKATYRFRAKQRGAYLIMVYGNPTPLDITLKHPKKTCYILGNGSCELVSGPDERYDFEVTSNTGEPVQFNLMVTHSEGRGRYEGEVSQPVAIEAGNEHEGTVGVHESSYYSFTSNADGPYTIALSGTQSDLVWRLFDAAAYDVVLQQCDYHVGAQDETCRTFPLHGGTRYYVKVEEKSGVPGPYRLTVYGP